MGCEGFPRNVGMLSASEEMTMTSRPRRNHSPASKAKVSVAAITGEKTLIKLAQSSDVHLNQITQSWDQFLEGATGVFGAAANWMWNLQST
jgi:transposase-like protein